MDHRFELSEALIKDQFADGAQYDQTNQMYLYPAIRELLVQFLPNTLSTCLEIGPGSLPLGQDAGRMFINHDWHYLEPSSVRLRALQDRLGDSKDRAALGWAEDMEFDPNYFAAVVMLNGFFQVRSDYEAILEINRVLALRGRFLFNLQTADDVDIIVGRVLGHRNMVRMLRQFGFEPLCVWEGPVNDSHRTSVGGVERQAFIVVEKVRNARATDLNQPQLVPVNEGPTDDLYTGYNIDLGGRESYLA